tara:strand:- start:314 stop:727 length:414 start_codon:yes stop_codon:yes gene_type:complete
MIRSLIELANHLDSKGLSKEADYVDNIIKRSNGPILSGIGQKDLEERISESPADIGKLVGDQYSKLYSKVLDITNDWPNMNDDEKLHKLEKILIDLANPLPMPAHRSGAGGTGSALSDLLKGRGVTTITDQLPKDEE